MPPETPESQPTTTHYGTVILLALLENQDLIVLGLTIGFLILSLGIHEAAHAFVAWRCGDSTAKDMGRMTINPVPHIDLMMTIVVPLVMYISTSGAMIFGGAKPVPVMYHRLRNPLRDMTLVALAGPLSNVLLAILFMLVWKTLVYEFDFSRDELVARVMWQSMGFNVLLAAFNMIPIPPLDGSRVLTWLLPPKLRDGYDALGRYGMLILVVLMISGSLWALVGPIMSPIYDFIQLITGGRWQ